MHNRRWFTNNDSLETQAPITVVYSDTESIDWLIDWFPTLSHIVIIIIIVILISVVIVIIITIIIIKHIDRMLTLIALVVPLCP